MRNKERIRKVIIFVLVVCVGFVLVGCSDKKKATTEKLNGKDLESSKKSEFVYSEKNEQDGYDLMFSYESRNFYWYCFNIGTMKNVIVDESDCTEEIKGVRGSFEIMSSRVTSKSISNAKTFVRERLEYDFHVQSLNYAISLGVEGIVEAGREVGISFYQDSTTKTTSSTNTETEEEVISSSIKKTIIIEQDGYLRISHYNDFQVFVLARESIETGEIEHDLVILPLNTGRPYGVTEFSEEPFPEFEDANPKVDISFDPTSIIESLPKPTIYKETLLLEEKIKLNPNLTIDDEGYFGLHGNDYSEIDLSKYSDYINNPLYYFEFEVILYVQEVNDGNKEVYLYNNKIPRETAIEDRVLAESYGLLDEARFLSDGEGRLIKTTTKYDPIILESDGSDTNSLMYLYYDAQGEKEDTWKLPTVEITISIFEK